MDRALARLFAATLPAGLAVDSLNGLLISAGIPAFVSLAFKVAMLGFGTWFLASRDARAFAIQTSIGVYVTAVLACHIALDGRAEALLGDLEWSARALLMVTYYLVFSHAFQRRLVTTETMARVFGICWIVVVANLAAGLAGFGFAQYGDRFGTAGFFFAGNELAAAMLAMSVVPLNWIYRTRSVFVYAVITITFVAAAVVTLTKTAVFGLMAIALGVPLFDLAASLLVRGRAAARPVRYLAVGLGVVAAGLIGAWVFLETSGFLDRLRFFFDRGGWIGLLLSGRDYMVDSAVRAYLDGAGAGQLVVGRGLLWLLETVGAQSESDFVDFAIAFGIPAMLLIVVCMSVVIVRAGSACLANRLMNAMAGSTALFAIILVGVAGAAGHVFNSGTAAGIIGATLASWRLTDLPVRRLWSGA